MLKLSLVVLCALAAVAVAYNFDNLDFNNFLFTDFKNIPSTITKRDTEDHHHLHHHHHHNNCESHTVFYCCKGDKFDPKEWEPLVELRRECMMEIFGKENVYFKDYNVFDCKQMEKLKSDVICVVNCVARKADLVDEEGTINKDAVRDLVKSKVEGSKWQMAAADKILDKCLNEEYNNDEKEGECRATPVKLLRCFWFQFIQSCPAKLHDKSEVCKRIRNNLSGRAGKHQHNEAAFHHVLEDLKNYI